MTVRFIKASVIYFVLGVVLGMYMGMTNQFVFTSAHAHINLLGWVSLALSGLIYQAFPVASKNKLAVTHFWLLMIGVPLLSLALIMFGLGNHAIGGVLSAIGGFSIIGGVIVFAINVNINIKSN